jgi:hypothetical protein
MSSVYKHSSFGESVLNMYSVQNAELIKPDGIIESEKPRFNADNNGLPQTINFGYDKDDYEQFMISIIIMDFGEDDNLYNDKE